MEATLWNIPKYDLFDKNNVRQQGHRAWEAEHRWTVRAKADYVFPYSKTGQIKAGYQYFSYSEDGDYSMQFWNPDTKEFFWRDDIYNTFLFPTRDQLPLCDRWG